MLPSLCPQIGTVKDPKLRVQIVSQRQVFDENPAAFRAKYDQQQNALTARIVEAQKLLKQSGEGSGCLGKWRQLER